MQATFEAVPLNGTGREPERKMESVAIRAVAGFPLQLCFVRCDLFRNRQPVVTYGPVIRGRNLQWRQT
ncbi:hypothetical protein CN215_19975 [Sinorhizobium meliloti]|nr:hypothetical protein CN216_16070 [Sinorhizobium meliloti]RVH23312.1 hypothetical protein CN215_19975 [Sinorhizobium meliloti]